MPILSRAYRLWGLTGLLLIGVTLFNAVAILRGGSGNLWALIEAGSFAAAYFLVPGFRARVNYLWRSSWQQAELFPVARTSIPWLAIVVLVVVPDALFLLLRDRGVQSGDSRPVVLTAASLVAEGDVELGEFAESYTRLHLFTPDDEAPYFFLRHAGRIYSHYPSGMVPFALPIVATARLLDSDLDDPTVHERLEKLTAACVSAACLGLFFLIALHLADVRTAYVASVILATGSAMFSTVGQALWQHGGVILWMEVLLLIEFRTWKATSWKSILGQGLACAMLLACRLSAGLIVVSFGLWLLFRAPRRAFAVAGIACLAAVPWAAFHWSMYGNPLGPMAVQTNQMLWSWPDARDCGGVLLSPTHGLLTYQPWLLLLLVRLKRLKPGREARLTPADRLEHSCADHQLKLVADQASRLKPAGAGDGKQPVAQSGSYKGNFLTTKPLPQPPSQRAPLPPGWRMWALVIVATHLALVMSWNCWWGGWCWGSRLLSEDIPLLALFTLRPLATLMTTPRCSRIVFAIAIVSALVHVPSVYLMQQRWYNQPGRDLAYGTWSAPPFLFPMRR